MNLFFGDINAKVDLSNYATKTDLKNVTHVSSVALKSNLASLKIEVDKLDIDKLVPIPVTLSKLSDVVKNDVVKWTDYNKLVTKVDNIDTTNFVKKNKCEKDGSDFEDKISKIDKKIPDVSSLVKKTDFNTKVTETEGKIPSITGLTTNSELTAVENKIPNVSSLVKKTDYNTKISNIEKKITDHNHDKYVTTPEFNTMTASIFNATLAAQTDLIRKPEFDFKLQGISDKVTKYKTKHLLAENELKKLTLCLSYFWGRNYFEGNHGAQNYLVFQVKEKYFEDNSGSVSSSIKIWKSKGLSYKSLSLSRSVGGANNIKMCKPIRPEYVIFNNKRSFFVQKKESVIKRGSIVNIYIV